VTPLLRNTVCIATAILAVALGACGGDSAAEPVTETEARGLLDRTVALATTGELRYECEETGAPSVTCERDLRQYGETPPAGHTVEVLGASVIEEAESTMPGLVLELCISSGSGQPYRSDFLVQRDPGGGLVVPYPVYWSGVQIGAAAATGSPTTEAGVRAVC
jgi:hypothetical protein